MIISQERVVPISSISFCIIGILFFLGAKFTNIRYLAIGLLLANSAAFGASLKKFSRNDDFTRFAGPPPRWPAAGGLNEFVDKELMYLKLSSINLASIDIFTLDTKFKGRKILMSFSLSGGLHLFIHTINILHNKTKIII